MPKHTVSRPAQAELRGIVRYTHDRWGAGQAVRFIQSLQACFQTLAQSPGMGRACYEVSPGLHRHEHGKHVVYYLLNPGGIRVVRVLHQQMLPIKPHFEK
ncbi:MAG: type II toxin-antitoxin system RelE/ParE family toxin [Terracidiphilus sp.]|nr:type II toxin-antitoxin system RelE/ParE family toxin [Terracidiphilus sp.]